jgi:Ras-related protein Rab-1A
MENSAFEGDKFVLKAMVVGDPKIGKTNFISAISVCLCKLNCTQGKPFNPEPQPTIGVDLGCILHKVVEGKNVKILLWDTGEQQKFHTFTSTYRGINLLLIGYDITDKSSWEHVCHWQQEIERYASSNIDTAVIGFKTDLADKRSVTKNVVDEYCLKNNFLHTECSAKLGENIEKSLDYVLIPAIKRAAEEREKKKIEQKKQEEPSLLEKFANAFLSLFTSTKKEQTPVVDSKTLELVVNGNKVQILEEIGTGGTSHVFKATWNGNSVAVKVFRTDENATISAEKELKVLKY